MKGAHSDFEKEEMMLTGPESNADTADGPVFVFDAYFEKERGKRDAVVAVYAADQLAPKQKIRDNLEQFKHLELVKTWGAEYRKAIPDLYVDYNIDNR